MAKKAPPLVAARRRAVWLGWRLPILVSFAFCMLALLRLHSPYNLSSSPPDSLAGTRLRVLIPRHAFAGPPKIAFLFLVRLDLPLDFLWGSFFKNADMQKFSIFVHSKPGFELDESTTRSHFFYDRQLKNSIQVEWGKASMIEAERLLLAAALEDAANQRFVLLSDSCVPLYNFSYIYSYLMASPRSFVDR
uniref:Uncharacterized protein LOC103324430 n=1 Tax=Rhizophora mucronata TaxID=61149 RepID=A0A2P2J015_RHIMU